MAVITISRGSYSYGKEVAVKLAEKLDYACICREVLLDDSAEFKIPEIKLLQAVENAPSFIDHFTHGKQRYIAYMRSALLKYIVQDHIVYHGFAGHFLLQGIAHVLKVRVSTTMENRVALVRQRDNISSDAKAERMIKKIDRERYRWAHYFYGQDPADMCLYDLCLHIDTLSVDDAIDNIIWTANRPCFQTTPASQKNVDDLSLAAEVRLSLVKEFPNADVSANDGVVSIRVEGGLAQEKVLTSRIEQLAHKVAGVQQVRVDVVPL